LIGVLKRSQGREFADSDTSFRAPKPENEDGTNTLRYFYRSLTLPSDDIGVSTKYLCKGREH